MYVTLQVYIGIFYPLSILGISLGQKRIHSLTFKTFFSEHYTSSIMSKAPSVVLSYLIICP